MPGTSVRPDGSTVFRLPGPIVLWWAWVVFAVANLVDIAITGRDHTAAEIAVALLVITGLVYACALRPRVITDGAGLTVQNPVRDHRVPWGSVTGVDLGDSVQVHCAQEPGAKRGKVISSWALYSPRRARYKANLRANRANSRASSGRGSLLGSGWTSRRYPPSASPVYGRMPPEAAALRKKGSAEIIAQQLDELARQARDGGAASGPRVVTWAWPAIGAIVVPAVVLAVLIAIF